MSPFILGGIGGLARARVKAERDHQAARNDETRKTLRTVMSKQWGVPYVAAASQDRFGRRRELAERAEPALRSAWCRPGCAS
jgi:hypothetical protein